MLSESPSSPGSEETLVRLKEILRSILLLDNTDSLTADTRFMADLNFDSIQMVDVVIAMEEGFNVKLPSDINIYEAIQTLGSAAQLIDSLLDRNIN